MIYSVKAKRPRDENSVGDVPEVVRVVVQESAHVLQALFHEGRPVPQGRLLYKRVVSPVSDAPYGIARDFSREKPVDRVHGAIFHLWAFGDFGVIADKNDFSPLVFPHDDIEITDFSSVLLV